METLLKELQAAYANAGLDCGDGLLPPASEEDIQKLEALLKLRVPDELRDILRIHGGQEYIGAGITGFFGQHRLHTPPQIEENYRMYQTHCLRDPLPEFPPKPNDWGYWVPDLIPFASWDAYDLCIHSHRGDVWEFCPNVGLRTHRPNITAVLRELIEVVNNGQEPELIRKGNDQNLRGEDTSP